MSYHKIKTLDKDTLLNELDKRVDFGLIDKQEKDNLVLYNYSRQAQYDGAWDDYVKISRGLIIDQYNNEVVALPFEKFFNYGDEHNKHGDSINDQSFSESLVTTKEDGSLGIVWCYNGEWNVSTRGSFESDQAIWATRFLRDNFNLDLLNGDYTYLVEIIYSENQIVVNYGDREDLVLIGCYNRISFQELDIDEANSETGLQFNTTKLHAFDNIDSIVETSHKLSKDEEGYVVKFKNGVRVKIKGDEYCRIHKLVSLFSKKRVWELLRDCAMAEIEKYKVELPEEFLDEFNQYIHEILVEKQILINKIRAYYELTKEFDDKRLGQEISKRRGTIEAKFVFACRKNNFLEEVENFGNVRFQFFKLLKPE